MSFREVHPTHPMSSQEKGIPEEVTIPKEEEKAAGQTKGKAFKTQGNVYAKA